MSGHEERTKLLTACPLARLGVLVLALAVAALSRGSAAMEPAATAQPAPPTLTILVASDHPTYGPGSAALFTLAVDNPTEAPITMTFPSAQTYDLVVYSGETEVWRSSAGSAFAAALAERIYPPGVTLLGRERWGWLDTGGTPLPPGTYRVVGTLTAMAPLSGNAVEITLTGL
jgi:Intracellular proteinase inhibitor